jgi:hypothetical protein
MIFIICFILSSPIFLEEIVVSIPNPEQGSFQALHTLQYSLLFRLASNGHFSLTDVIVTR